MSTPYLTRIFYNSLKMSRNNGQTLQYICPSIYSNKYAGDEVIVSVNDAYTKYNNEINGNKQKEIKPVKPLIIK